MSWTHCALSDHDLMWHWKTDMDAAIVFLKLGNLLVALPSKVLGTAHNERLQIVSLDARISIGLGMDWTKQDGMESNLYALGADCLYRLLLSLQEHKTLIHNQRRIECLLTSSQPAVLAHWNQWHACCTSSQTSMRIATLSWCDM